MTFQNANRSLIIGRITLPFYFFNLICILVVSHIYRKKIATISTATAMVSVTSITKRERKTLPALCLISVCTIRKKTIMLVS